MWRKSKKIVGHTPVKLRNFLMFAHEKLVYTIVHIRTSFGSIFSSCSRVQCLFHAPCGELRADNSHNTTEYIVSHHDQFRFRSCAACDPSYSVSTGWPKKVSLYGVIIKSHLKPVNDSGFFSVKYECKRSIEYCQLEFVYSVLNILYKYFKFSDKSSGWFGVAVTAFVTSTKLSYVEPG